MKDETLKQSSIRSLEIIGEASKNIHDDFKRKFEKIPWKKMAGLRDVLIHHYFGVDYLIVWDVVKNLIPELSMDINNLIKEISNENNFE